MEGRVCSECGSTTTLMEQHFGKPYPRWHNIDGKCHCWRCWKRLIQYHRYDKKYDREVRQAKRIQFKDKRIRLKEKPRTGYCSWCSANIHDGSCKRTSLHHVEYIDGKPLEKTIEVCNSCHNRESHRLRRLKKNSSSTILDYI